MAVLDAHSKQQFRVQISEIATAAPHADTEALNVKLQAYVDQQRDGPVAKRRPILQRLHKNGLRSPVGTTPA